MNSNLMSFSYRPMHSTFMGEPTQYNLRIQPHRFKYEQPFKGTHAHDLAFDANFSQIPQEYI